MKCVLCSKPILSNQKCVRVLVEEVTPGEDEHNLDPTYWSNTEAWDLITGMHSTCIVKSLARGNKIPYEAEIETLRSYGNAILGPPIKLVQGGKV